MLFISLFKELRAVWVMLGVRIYNRLKKRLNLLGWPRVVIEKVVYMILIKFDLFYI
jgi:hypothetical protein